MRWAIEVTSSTAAKPLGVGQARNRTAPAVEGTFAFGMYVWWSGTPYTATGPRSSSSVACPPRGIWPSASKGGSGHPII
jgi:hypothetical protein